jgi:sugar/nucleoside kinase (ribokinase family)
MSDKIKEVLCIGDLVADIISNPLRNLPNQGEAVLTKHIEILPGGNALNTAVALFRMGDAVRLAGSVGDDALGTLLLQQLTEYGLDVRGIHREKGTTSSTFILLVEGEDRRFISALGVAEHFTGEHLSFDLIPENGIVLVGGYLKLAAWNDDILIDFLKQAHKKNNMVVLNVCYLKNSDVDPKRVLPLLKYIDIFAPNEDEAFAITGETDLRNQAGVLREAGAKLVVITRGPQGLYAENSDESIAMGTINVPIVDPSGCGDCFTAGLLAALRRDLDIVKMLKFGSAAGALGATALGCTTGVPLFDDVKKFLNKHRLDILVRPLK